MCLAYILEYKHAQELEHQLSTNHVANITNFDSSLKEALRPQRKRKVVNINTTEYWIQKSTGKFQGELQAVIDKSRTETNAVLLLEEALIIFENAKEIFSTLLHDRTFQIFDPEDVEPIFGQIQRLHFIHAATLHIIFSLLTVALFNGPNDGEYAELTHLFMRDPNSLSNLNIAIATFDKNWKRLERSEEIRYPREWVLPKGTKHPASPRKTHVLDVWNIILHARSYLNLAFARAFLHASPPEWLDRMIEDTIRVRTTAENAFRHLDAAVQLTRWCHFNRFKISNMSKEDEWQTRFYYEKEVISEEIHTWRASGGTLDTLEIPVWPVGSPINLASVSMMHNMFDADTEYFYD